MNSMLEGGFLENLNNILATVNLELAELAAFGILGVAVLLLLVYFFSGRGRASGGRASGGVWLEDLSGTGKSGKVKLQRGVSLMVGRVPVREKGVANLVVPQSTVGRRHAVIDFRNGGFWLSDQNSTNGTFVNGTRLEQSQRLNNGDVIMFHEYPFRFVDLDEEAEGEKTVVAGGSMDEATLIATAATAGARPGTRSQATPGNFQSPQAVSGSSQGQQTGQPPYPVDKSYEAALENMVSDSNKGGKPPVKDGAGAGTVGQASALVDDLDGVSGVAAPGDVTLDNFIDDATISKAPERGKK